MRPDGVVGRTRVSPVELVGAERIHAVSSNPEERIVERAQLAAEASRRGAHSAHRDQSPWSRPRSSPIVVLGRVLLSRGRVAMLVDEGLELLDEKECLGLLARAHIGRVAVTLGALPAIFPVNFVMDDDAVVFRTGTGTKLAAATDHAVLAFEADQFDRFEHTGWSVLAVGRSELVTDPEELRRLAGMPLTPWAGGSRPHFVRMPIEFISGRRITNKEGET